MPPPLSQQYDEPMTQLVQGRERLKSTLQMISARHSHGSVVARKKDDRKIAISIETLEQATNQLEKDVDEMLAQMAEGK